MAIYPPVDSIFKAFFQLSLRIFNAENIQDFTEIEQEIAGYASRRKEAGRQLKDELSPLQTTIYHIEQCVLMVLRYTLAWKRQPNQKAINRQEFTEFWQKLGWIDHNLEKTESGLTGVIKIYLRIATTFLKLPRWELESSPEESDMYLYEALDVLDTANAVKYASPCFYHERQEIKNIDPPYFTSMAHATLVFFKDHHTLDTDHDRYLSVLTRHMVDNLLAMRKREQNSETDVVAGMQSMF
jgi:hypothetical protein